MYPHKAGEKGEEEVQVCGDLPESPAKARMSLTPMGPDATLSPGLQS